MVAAKVQANHCAMNLIVRLNEPEQRVGTERAITPVLKLSSSTLHQREGWLVVGIANKPLAPI